MTPASLLIVTLLLTPLRAAEVLDLRCDSQVNPIGIDVEKPGLSWKMGDGDQKKRGLNQSAYQIIVASSEARLINEQGDLWDSGKVASGQSMHVEYAGRTLESRMRCHWKVRVWDQHGKDSEWSKPAGWTMGLLSASDWQAKWIKSPSETANEAQYFRKDFNVEKPVKRAVVRFACLGFADILINSRKTDESVMIAPRFANPEYRVIYTTLDATRMLRLQALRNPPVRRFESVKAPRREGNSYIFEGAYTGFPRLKVRGKAGDVVSIRGNEKLAMRKIFGPVVIDFTLRDDNEVILEPRFFAHTIGPEFTISGLDHLPAAEDVSIESVHADLNSGGEFECSNPLFNELHQVGMPTHLNYVLNYPMDPTREKAGWSQGIQNMFVSASYLTDTMTLYEEWWQDYADFQRADGQVASVAPTNIGFLDTLNDPWWGGMIIYAPWRIYEFYGDVQILKRAHEPMKRYFSWLRKQADATGGILEWAGASDWIEVGIEGWGPPKRTPKFLVSTMAYIHYADILAKSSALLGCNADAATYRKIAASTREIFNSKYLDPATGLYAGATDSQASLIMPLALGVVPEENKALVIQRLMQNIKNWKDHLNTGFVSNPYLLHGLTDLGLADRVGRIMNQKDWPSFYNVAKDGVFMETWRGGMAQMPSLGGSSTAWFYRAILGIRNDPAQPGFKHIIIKPEMMPEVTWARGHYDSVCGRVVSNWKLETAKLTMEATIPPNATATVFVPAKDVETLTESGKPVSKAEGVKFLRLENGAAVFAVGSGTYRFQSMLTPSTESPPIIKLR